MGEIKFRGNDGGGWIYGTAVDYEKETDTWYMLEYGAHNDDWQMVGEVGQYTGIKDKESNEIYENDILQEDKTGKLFRCEWVDKLAAFKLVLMTDPQTMFGMSVAGSFTVVGNVHELGAE